jgi:hypothetical protein
MSGPHGEARATNYPPGSAVTVIAIRLTMSLSPPCVLVMLSDTPSDHTRRSVISTTHTKSARVLAASGPIESSMQRPSPRRVRPARLHG